MRKRVGGHTYIWRFHRELSPTRVISLRGMQAFYGKSPPKSGNRNTVQALVRFDTEQVSPFPSPAVANQLMLISANRVSRCMISMGRPCTHPPRAPLSKVDSPLLRGSGWRSSWYWRSGCSMRSLGVSRISFIRPLGGGSVCSSSVAKYTFIVGIGDNIVIVANNFWIQRASVARKARRAAAPAINNHSHRPFQTPCPELGHCRHASGPHY